MEKLMAFLSSFSSYLLVYIVFIAVIIVGIILGISTAKAKNKKAAEVVSDSNDDTDAAGSEAN